MAWPFGPLYSIYFIYSIIFHVFHIFYIFHIYHIFHIHWSHFFGKLRSKKRWRYMIMMPARGWRWTSIWRMPNISAWHITRACGKVSHLQFAPDKSTYRRSCVFFRFFFRCFFPTALVWFSSTSPEEDPLWGVWQRKPVLSTRLLLRNSHRRESPRHSIYALGISHSAQRRRSRRLRVRHPSGVISSAGLRCAGCQPDSCNPTMVQFGTLRCPHVGWKVGRVWRAFWSFLIITPFDKGFQTFKMGTDAVQFDVSGAWSSSDSFNDHFWIVPGVLGLKLSCRHLNFAGRKQGTQARRLRTSVQVWNRQQKRGCTTQKGANFGLQHPIKRIYVSNNYPVFSMYFPWCFPPFLMVEAIKTEDTSACSANDTPWSLPWQRRNRWSGWRSSGDKWPWVCRQCRRFSGSVLPLEIWSSAGEKATQIGANQWMMAILKYNPQEDSEKVGLWGFNGWTWDLSKKHGDISWGYDRNSWDIIGIDEWLWINTTLNIIVCLNELPNKVRLRSFSGLRN